jgi:hypothetical protein
MEQYGGVVCSICKSPDTNKSTCPCNPDIPESKHNIDNHPLCKGKASLSKKMKIPSPSKNSTQSLSDMSSSSPELKPMSAAEFYTAISNRKPPHSASLFDKAIWKFHNPDPDYNKNIVLDDGKHKISIYESTNSDVYGIGIDCDTHVFDKKKCPLVAEGIKLGAIYPFDKLEYILERLINVGKYKPIL